MQQDIKIVRFGGRFKPIPEQFSDLKTLINQCEDLYPGIDNWYKKKVVPGIEDKERTAYIIYNNSEPVGATILRKGQHPKLCSLRILPKAEKGGLGTLLMGLVARDLRHYAKDVHFTIPDCIWDQKQNFFKQYGFKSLGESKEQYRLFDRELSCSVDFSDFWNSVIKKLPKIFGNYTINGTKLKYDLVLSIKPQYASEIFNGRKKVEIRRKFSKKWRGSNALIYSTSPCRSYVGTIFIDNVVSGSPDEIWETFGSEIGCDESGFRSYTHNSKEVYALVIDESYKFKYPVLNTQLEQLLYRDLSVPQSYNNIESSEIWREAASINSLLQATL